MVTDVVGIEAAVGQRVAFGQSNAGAKELRVGTITDIATKTVLIQWSFTGEDWRGKVYSENGFIRRNSGAYAVVQDI